MDFSKTAFRCVEETKSIFINGYHSLKTIEYKGDINPVTSVDKAVENKIISIIRSDHPYHNILTEESKPLNQSSEYRWIIDPLDGTVNFAHNIPHFALSIALEYRSIMILGIVYNPMTNELFFSEKNNGAYLNNKKIAVSHIKNIKHSLIATGFPYDSWINADLYSNELNKFLKTVQGIRRAGVASLDLCYLACGRYDGFWERKLSPWDVAASILLIEEAGGKVSNFLGDKYTFSQDNIIASNNHIHNDMIKILN